MKKLFTVFTVCIIFANAPLYGQQPITTTKPIAKDSVEVLTPSTHKKSEPAIDTTQLKVRTMFKDGKVYYIREDKNKIQIKHVHQ